MGAETDVCSMIPFLKLNNDDVSTLYRKKLEDKHSAILEPFTFYLYTSVKFAFYISLPCLQ